MTTQPTPSTPLAAAETPPETRDLLGPASCGGTTPTDGDDPPVVEDLLAAGEVDPRAAGGLESLRVGNDEVAIVLFTSQSTSVAAHYIEDEDARGYMRCGRKGCLLCQAGMKASSHILLPVFVPEAGGVQVLMLSTSLRPTALLPQVKQVLRQQHPCVTFIQKKGQMGYSVSSRPLSGRDDDGAAAIKAFTEMQPPADLRRVLNAYDPDLITSIARIAAKLKVKGIA